ncbi:DUF6194 family protein [Nocardia caishijiensis]|uniref:DUF6194 domain-containing protein n=1 Tax=Nocardia caishijiensis TaxID=184756 RepID=A0ABQ6YQX0_9NOCA|nr:DUF6194 family protein [Nocardia caishijiensis]KAF0848121.1 hypothetical protein FNL39_102268 [Nocardia caishijiensis]
MQITEIDDFVTGLDGVLALRPAEGSDFPEISWGDIFYYYAPDGVVPRTQPFATIITKNYPDDTASDLDRPGAFRLNVAVTKSTFTEHAANPLADNTFAPHPQYPNWLSITDPGRESAESLRNLIREAHARTRTRIDRRAGAPGTDVE